MNTSARSSGYDNLPTVSDHSKDSGSSKRKESTRDLNGSYILACRGEDSLNSSTVLEPLSPVSARSSQKPHEEYHAVYTSITLEDSDDDHDRSRHKRSRIISDSIGDRSLPNPANVSSNKTRHICNSIPDLTTLPNPDSSLLSDAPLCRICHEGDEDEDLVSPCFCSGSVGALHMSCLEKWLGTADMTRCEICEFQFTVAKNPKPFTWFLKNKSLGRERRFLIADILCAICFTPFALAAFTGCLVGASYFSSLNKDWQATTLILLAMTSLLILSLWCGFTLRRNYILCSTWRENFQEIKIKYNPPDKNNNNRQPFTREASGSGRKLLDNDCPMLASPDFPSKSITRKITYEKSPGQKKERRSSKLEDDIDSRCSQRQGTPFIKRKTDYRRRKDSIEEHEEIALTDHIKGSGGAQTYSDGKPDLRNKKVDRLRVHSTSTPASKQLTVKQTIFDERHCSATPIHRSPYVAIPIEAYPMEMIGMDHTGMFIKTPYTNVHHNMSNKPCARRGLLTGVTEETSENTCVIPPDGLYASETDKNDK